MPKRVICDVTTPLGERVILTRDRWREITRFKHPAVAGHETDVRDCLCDPVLFRASNQDASVHLYYRQIGSGKYVCVVIAGDPSNRFVVTAYLTKKIKTGAELWKK